MSLSLLFQEVSIKQTFRQTCFTLIGHTNIVRAGIFLANDRYASCSFDRTIKIWNVRNGKEIFELKGHTDWVYSLVALQNCWLASGSSDD